MTPQRPQPPPSFLGPTDELNYWYDLIRYYERTAELSSVEAKNCLRRFEQLLADAGMDDGTILIQKYWAVLHEARGNLSAAVPYREREIELIERLFEIGGPVRAVVPAHSIDYEYLSREMRILLRHYEALGQAERAAELRRRMLRRC